MRSFEKKQQRAFSAFLIGLLLMPCTLLAQTANQKVWWLKTGKGRYIEMSRVIVLTNVNKEGNFEVVVLTENSFDAWKMINYLRIHTATVDENNILKVSNVDMQNLLGNDSNNPIKTV